jgi:putative DNA primase/helicase
MMNRKALSVAMDYLRAGISVVPIRADGSKAAKVAWKEFMERMPTVAELRSWFGHDTVGIALVTGLLSDGLEIIDFDHYKTYLEWRKLVDPEILKKLTIVKTPRPGAHICYRCDEISHSHAVASLKNDDGTPGKKLIETRSEGSYAVTEGSHPSVHETGREYKHAGGPPLTKLTRISIQERLHLFEMARKFDEYNHVEEERRNRRHSFFKKLRRYPQDKFIEWYNDQETWTELLYPFGWRNEYEQDTGFWVRPGKSSGTSAHATVSRKEGNVDVLVVFTTSPEAGPIASKGSHVTYNKFNVFRLLYCDGDKAVAREKVKAKFMEEFANGKV